MKPPIKIVRLNDIIPKFTKPSVTDKKVYAEFDKWVRSIGQAFVEIHRHQQIYRAEAKEANAALRMEIQELRRIIAAGNNGRPS